MSSENLKLNSDLTNTMEIGRVMYTDHILYFQLSGMILLLAMIGAIILTYRKRTNIKTQSYINQISREKKSSIEIREVEFEKGVKIDD